MKIEDRIMSPFIEGGYANLKEEERVIYYMGKKVSYMHLYYVCNETNIGFTTTELDVINLKRVEDRYNS